MKTTLRLLLWITLVSLLAAVLVVTVGSAWLRHEAPEALLHFGDQAVTARDMHAGHWLVGTLGIALALMIVFTVVPLAVAFALLATGGALMVALVLLILSLAWITAPLWLVGLLLWWALRTRRPHAAAAG